MSEEKKENEIPTIEQLQQIASHTEQLRKAIKLIAETLADPSVVSVLFIARKQHLATTSVSFSLIECADEITMSHMATITRKLADRKTPF